MKHLHENDGRKVRGGKLSQGRLRSFRFPVAALEPAAPTPDV
jgi:hypothetical protein